MGGEHGYTPLIGIGREIVLNFARLGAILVLWDIDEEVQKFPVPARVCRYPSLPVQLSHGFLQSCDWWRLSPLSSQAT
uniref:Uncharacterized protein n=1 Tax=Salvator merianae TaxID=96440 RepID=A0A8D0KF50_SALMN